MAWGDPQDYWWLKPAKDSLPAMQLGAQLRQQMVATALKEKDQELETQRYGIQLQEYFSKKELQNSMMEGSSVMAKTLAGFKDQSDPNIPEAIYGVMAKYRGLEKLGTEYLEEHRKSVEFKQRQNEIKELRMSRERIAQVRDAAAVKKLEMLGEHWSNQDAAAALRTELLQINQEANLEDRIERRRMFDTELDRRIAADQLRREQFDAKQKQMPAEQKMRYQNKTKALENEAVMGRVRDLKTGKMSAEEYQRRSKAIEDEFFGAEKKAAPLSPSGQPLDMELKAATKKYFNPETGQTQDTPYAPSR